MEISKGIEIVDLGLKIGKTLIIADIHIGFEEALNKQGIMIPRFQFDDVVKRIGRILRQAKPETVVVNGDIKHEFGRISDQEWRETLKIIDLLLEKSKKVVLIRGNHDTILGPIAKKRNIEVLDRLEIDDGRILIVHGHKEVELPKVTKTIIIAHEHPAVSLREGPRTEVFKCFLKGKYKGRELIVIPSFNLVTEGTDILKEELLSPFLHQNLDDFEVFIVSDMAYAFGKLKNLRKYE
ncbi:MAG TPA: metallophosphoesterase [Candidatus Nanoarchaeia archaeon]|nr:metallophosphoesterase [Candidatus Nanoarchaeia archaeon]